MQPLAELLVSKWNTQMEMGFSMTDNTKYEINRRYPFEGDACPVDGETMTHEQIEDILNAVFRRHMRELQL